MDEEVRIGSDPRGREKQQSLEVRVSRKRIIKEFGNILNPFRSARLLASNTSSERNPLLAKTLDGIGFSAPFIVVGSVIGIISAGAYGLYRLLEKQLY